MIFNSNHTNLGSTIPMAEGYDCGYGTALALVESARNDMEMFKAMISADYQELGMRQSGYTNEASITALHEATGGGIFKKIAELISKLVAKIKSIFHTFVGKMNGLFMKDKDLVKKYEKEVLRKSNIGNLEVKWCKKKSTYDTATNMDLQCPTALDNGGIPGGKTWDSEAEKRYKAYFPSYASNFDWDSFESDFDEACFDDEDTLKISEVGGIRQIMNDLTGFQKKISTAQKSINTNTRNLEKLVSDANKKANEATTKKDNETDADAQARVDDANHAYDMAQAMQTVNLKVMQCGMDALKKMYKQTRAAFAKAITASDKKLEESAMAQAYVEAAEDEVEDVINGAISDEDLSDLTSATDYVKDTDVSDDPEALVYDKVQKYTDDAPMDTASGSVDVDVNARTESAFFGKLLY